MNKARFFFALATVLAACAGATVPGRGASGQRGINPLSSFPLDTHHYVRQNTPEDFRLKSRGIRANAISGVTMKDVVVSNTDPNLKTTDTNGDEECSIAINPLNTNQIVVSGFGEAAPFQTAAAPIFYSSDGGNTWTKEFSVTPPPGGVGISSD